ncbi:cadherin-related family member 3-like [Mauremys reevesii]|uniref:cadherin-related family member 3-like n=1 Tax=Mauremys reevesii TaxID=260615 RepID=UPI00193ECADD|nr:cadherin-related family member 3-like [Mauremys reevesii]
MGLHQYNCQEISAHCDDLYTITIILCWMLRSRTKSTVQGGKTLSLNGLPATGNVTEKSSAYVLVYTFNVTLSPSPSEVAPGYPLIINSNPLTKAFRIDPGATHTYKVVTTGDPVLDYETMPNSFDLQIYVKDTAGASDLQILTVQITDVNEPPVFRGNLADQSKRTSIAWK